MLYGNLNVSYYSMTFKQEDDQEFIVVEFYSGALDESVHTTMTLGELFELMNNIKMNGESVIADRF